MKRFKPILFCLLTGVLSATSGCSVGPDYVRPGTEVPAAYKELEDWKRAEPQDQVPAGAWWEVFANPELSALVAKVNISNQNVAAAEAAYRQARAAVQAARAGYFPVVTAGTAAVRSRPSAARTRGSSSASVPTTTDYLLSADLSWEIDVWGRVRRLVEASEANAQASAADLEAIRLSSQAELAQDFFLLRTLDGQKQLLEETITVYRKNLELTKNRYNAGVVSKTDVLQADTQLKVTQAQAIDVGVQRALLEHAIASLSGQPASLLSLPVAPLTAVPPDVPVGVPSQLLERRPDIASAERLMAAANAQIGVAIAAYFPVVTLSGSAGYEAIALSRWLDWPSRFWAIGAALSETVFEGGLRKAQTEEARAAYDQAVAFYRQTVLTGFQDVEDNLAALRILAEEARAQDEAVKAARETVKVTLNQYRAGTASYLEVIVAQAVALNNERTALDIQGRRMTASVFLIKALGGGWNTANQGPETKPDDRSRQP